MTQISASLVKELRERTGAGMMDCKRALEDANGDLEVATRLLREKGMHAAAASCCPSTASTRPSTSASRGGRPRRSPGSC